MAEIFQPLFETSEQALEVCSQKLEQASDRDAMFEALREAGNALARPGLLLAIVSDEDVGDPLQLPDMLTSIILDGVRRRT